MVAIKDFGMPSCCMNCEMQIDGLSAGYYCAITEEELNDNGTLEHRHTNCPLVEIEERKVGYWRPVYQGDEIIDYRCSNCDFGSTFGKGTYGMNYCNNCGSYNQSIIEKQGSENG